MIHMVNCMCIHNDAQLKLKLQHTGTWSDAVWPPCCLFSRWTLFFHHLHLIMPKFSYLGTHFKNIILYLFISLFLFYFLRIMKFCKSWSACIGSDTGLMWSNQAPLVDLLWKYKLNPKCNKRMAVLVCSVNYCMLVSNIVTAAIEESWWRGSVSVRYIYSKCMHYGVNRLLVVFIYWVISQKK